MKNSRISKDIFLAFWLRFKYFFIMWYIPLKYAYKEYYTLPRIIDTKGTDWNKRPGDVAIVTGATQGYGLQTVKQLLSLDFHVILAVRNVDAGTEALIKIRDSGIISGSASIQFLNLSSFESVKTFAAKILENYRCIHLLFNIAGVGFERKTITEDDNINIFQVNFLSHFLLTNLLLQRMSETGRKCGRNSRIINMASVAQYGGNLDFTNLQTKENYIASKVYFDSKLSTVMYTKFLAKRLKKQNSSVSVYSLHPGITPTSIWEKSSLRGDSSIKSFLMKRRDLFPKIEDTVKRVINVALSEEIEEISGAFFMNDQPTKCNPQADDPILQNKLWEASRELTQAHLTTIQIQ